MRKRRKKIQWNKEKISMWMIVLLVLTAVLSFGYFCMLLRYVGPMSFFFMFLFLAFGCFVLAGIWYLHLKGKISVPRRLSAAFRVVLALGVVLFGVLFGMILHGQNIGPEDDADYLVVLGAGLRGDKPSLVLMYRIRAAAEYLLEHPDSKVVVSGGQGANEWISEAEAMRRELLDLGVDESRIYLEDKSTSTNENLTFSGQFIPEGASVVIVTNKFHVFRACHLAREVGYDEVSGLGADNVWWLNPTNYLRECMAVFKDVVLP